MENIREREFEKMCMYVKRRGNKLYDSTLPTEA
jgi:hypothetical protein